MRELIELLYSFLESYFDFDNPDKTLTQKLLKAILGLILFLLSISLIVIIIVIFK